jgi:hypothetical protein
MGKRPSENHIYNIYIYIYMYICMRVQLRCQRCHLLRVSALYVLGWCPFGTNCALYRIAWILYAAAAAAAAAAVCVAGNAGGMATAGARLASLAAAV